MKSSWALVELAHHVAGHFERGFDKLPTRSIVAWAKTVLLGIGVTFLVLFGLIIYGRYRLGHEGRLTWEIEEFAPGVTKVTTVHDGFASRTATFESVAGGAPFILSALKSLLETGEPLVRSTRSEPAQAAPA